MNLKVLQLTPKRQRLHENQSILCCLATVYEGRREMNVQSILSHEVMPEMNHTSVKQVNFCRRSDRKGQVPRVSLSFDGFALVAEY